MGLGMFAMFLFIPAIGIAVILAHPVIRLLPFHELSEYAAPRLAKLKQG